MHSTATAPFASGGTKAHVATHCVNTCTPARLIKLPSGEPCGRNHPACKHKGPPEPALSWLEDRRSTRHRAELATAPTRQPANTGPSASCTAVPSNTPLDTAMQAAPADIDSDSYSDSTSECLDIAPPLNGESQHSKPKTAPASDRPRNAKPAGPEPACRLFSNSNCA